MKIVQPEVYVLTPPTSQHANSIYKFLETIGRTCYKSEDKITDMSWIKFISNIKNRGHWAMLEHYIFIIELSEKFYFKLMDEMVMFMADDAVFSNYIGYIKFSRIQMEPKEDSHSAKFIVSFSATCINNLWKCDSIKNNPKCAFAGLFVRMKTLYPDIILAPDYIENSGSFGGEYLPIHWENGNFPAKVIDIPDLAKYVHDDASINAYMLHSWITARLIVDTGCCYSDDTKVLTRDGWKYFKDIEPDDEFYSLDDDNNIVYEKAIKFIKKRYIGKIHHWHTTQIDLMVTPNHNMWVYDYDKRSPDTRKWKFIKSEDMTNNRYMFAKSANPINIENNAVTINQYIRPNGFYNKLYSELKFDSDLFYELLGYWLTDGYLLFGKNRNEHVFGISQVKIKHRNRIHELLDSLNIKYRVTLTTFFINCPQLFWYLFNNFIKSKDDVRKSYYLKIPRGFLDSLSKSNLEALLTGIIGGNGTKHTKGKGYQIYTGSKSFAEDIVEICLRCGKCANIYTIPPRGRMFPGKSEVTLCKEQYVVSIITTNNTLFYKDNSKKSYMEEIDYNGYVYCVELKHYHRLYVMRDGKSCWCGNSHELVRHRACSFAQESTRYVNYSDGKYGSEISVIEPCFFEKGSYKYEQWMLGCQEAEAAYNILTDAGCKAQEARDVLPKSTKAEIVITARLNEWKHLFGLRCDKPAHPQMRQVAIPLMKAMKQVEGFILNENIVEKMFGGIPE